MSGKLKIGVFDEDNFVDELAGSLIFTYQDILKLPNRSFYWVNIFGAPGCEGFTQKGDTTAADEMNNEPTIASKWKGRVLFCIEYDLNVERPECGVEDTPEDIIKDA